MQGALSFTGWYSPAQIHQDMTQLMGVLTQHPEKLGRWAHTKSIDEIVALLHTLDLDSHHRQRLVSQWLCTANGAELTRQLTDCVIPSSTPDYGSAIAPSIHEVVWENERAQMIRYASKPGTPILLVPAVINKHYILDLCPERSLVQAMIAQGYECYCVVWKPITGDENEADYVKAIELALEALSGPLHLVGYCLGGLLAAQAALNSSAVQSLTLLASPLNGDAGAIEPWLTPLQRAHMVHCADARGCVPAGVLTAGFLSLKPESWSSLFRQDRFPELAVWLTDGLDVAPLVWHWIIDEVYGEGGMTASSPLQELSMPVWLQSFDQDHLVPPQSLATQGPVIQSRSPGGHNSGLLKLGAGSWIHGWSSWLTELPPIQLPAIDSDCVAFAHSGSAF